MSVTVSINGTNYNYPSGTDQDWGTDATATFQRLQEATLFQTGKRGDGADFTLSADLDLGANFGVIVEYLKSNAAALPTTGVIRLGNDEEIAWDSNTPGTDLTIKVNTSDELVFEGNKLIDASDSVTALSDVTNAGSGAIITAGERTQITTNQTDITALQARADASSGLFANAIINPIDENMVDQYGISGSVSHNTYLIDRWKLNEFGTNPTFSKDTTLGNIKLTANASETNRIHLQQAIEDVNYKRLNGKEVTVSAKVKSNNSTNCRILVYDGSSYFSTSVHTGGGTNETLTATFTLSSSISTLSVYVGILSDTDTNVSISSGDYCEFSNVKLEKGSSATSYQPRQYGEELALCQRYYNQMTFSDNQVVGSGWTDSGNFYVTIFTPVTMRSTPSISEVGGGTFVIRGDGTAETPVTPSVSAVRNGSLLVTGTQSTLTSNHGCSLCIASANSEVILNAEL